MISSDNGSGVYVSSSTINNFTNKGTIKTSGTAEPNQLFAALYASNGVNLRSAIINTFENSSSISGKVGVNLSASSIENFKNTGTIEGTSSANSLAAAINIQSFYSSGSTINNFTNEGTIRSSSNGIFIGDGSAIKTLTNSGTIEASLDGITFYGFHTNKKPVDIGKITIESGGVIKAGNNGINIDGSEWGITGEGIDVKGRLEGGNAGIYIGAGKQVNTSITVSGTIQGDNGGIINTGTIGQKDAQQQQHGITIENGGTITSKNGSGILNTDNGIIYGNIVNSSNND
ncbi:autotransporter outer membrane beta-barrel domain-containing protein, partial [Campylobacter sp. TTU_617]|nr:autotransporter outer membrane beta-barrel domain-containing protein [Campylobacter sp. TTU_617]